MRIKRNGSPLIRILPLLALLLPAVAAVQALAQDRKPINIVYILVDDLGFGDFSIYGNENAETPTVDRLAREGVRFNHAYVHPICSPTRVATTTGQWPDRWGVTTFLGTYEMNAERGLPDWLDPDAPSIARILRENGYATAQVGKWHMGGQRDVDTAPWIDEYGFDEIITNSGGIGDRILNVFDEITERGTIGPDVSNVRTFRGSTYWTPRNATTEAYVDHAMDFMGRMHAANRPFYVNLWTMDPHLPHEPPVHRRGDRSDLAMLTGVLEEMDLQFSRLIKFIESNPQLRDSTLVILASDNGASPASAGSNKPFRDGKGSLYEGAIRVPLIVWGPGVIPAEKAGTVDDTTITSMMDLPPTLLSLLGMETPADVKFDGIDVSRAYLGESFERTEPLFWSAPPGARLRINPPQLAVRSGDWKLLMMRDGSRVQLYNLIDDPAESVNIAQNEPERTRALKKKLTEWDARMTREKVQLPVQGARPAQVPPLTPHRDDLFADSFSRPDSDDLDASTAGLSGSVGNRMRAGNVYLTGLSGPRDNSESIRRQVLALAMGAGMSEVAINHNFVDDEIGRAGGFTVSMDILMMDSLATDLSNRYLGFGVGLTKQEAESGGNIFAQRGGTSYRGSENVPGSADLFVELDMERNVKVWRGGSVIASVPVFRGYGNLEARFALWQGFAAGDEVEVAVYFNGRRLDLDPLSSDRDTIRFAWSSPDSNYIGLSGRATRRVLADNLRVRKGFPE